MGGHRVRVVTTGVALALVDAGHPNQPTNQPGGGQTNSCLSTKLNTHHYSAQAMIKKAKKKVGKSLVEVCMCVCKYSHVSVRFEPLRDAQTRIQPIPNTTEVSFFAHFSSFQLAARL